MAAHRLLRRLLRRRQQRDRLAALPGGVGELTAPAQRTPQLLLWLGRRPGWVVVGLAYRPRLHGDLVCLIAVAAAMRERRLKSLTPDTPDTPDTSDHGGYKPRGVRRAKALLCH